MENSPMDSEDFPSHEQRPDSLEAHLARQRLRTVPPEWRHGILEQAHAAGTSTSSRVAHGAAPTRNSAWIQWLREFPVAWSALAAVWLCILALHAADRWLNGRPTSGPRISAEQWAELKRQKAELGELAGLRINPHQDSTHPDTDPKPPAALKPRSSRRPPQGPAWVRCEPPPRPARNGNIPRDTASEPTRPPISPV